MVQNIKAAVEKFEALLRQQLERAERIKQIKNLQIAASLIPL